MLSVDLQDTLSAESHILDIKNKLSDKKFLLQFLPEKLEPISTLKSIQFNDKKLKVSYIIDIVHNLLLKYYFTKEPCFNLSSLILRQKYGTDYNHYINYLASIGILKLISDYCVGKKTKTWQLTDIVINNPIKRFKNEDKTLMKKYIKNILSIEIKDINYSWIDNKIKQKLIDDLFYVSIDIESSMVYLNMLKQDIDSLNKNKFAVECVNDKHIFFHFDNFGRMHTNFTILKSFIRKNFLKIDGEEVCEVDIKNSQPLFLTKIVDMCDPGLIDQHEYNLFKYLAIKGQLYQYLMDEFKIQDKSEVKKIIYKVFFGRNQKTREDKLFKRVFPSIYDFIKFYKDKNGDYRTLAYELQRSESKLIFNNVIKEIMICNPEIKLFTVHDSIVYPKKYKNIVESIFYAKLEEAFGKIE